MAVESRADQCSEEALKASGKQSIDTNHVKDADLEEMLREQRKMMIELEWEYMELRRGTAAD